MINIAIDGPSGAGKSSCAKLIAKKLGYLYIDTGAMYRAIGLFCQRNGIMPDDRENVIPALEKINVELKFIDQSQHVYLNGEDVSSEIRRNEISMYASKVSAIAEVRAFLLDLQRNFAKENNVIMDGRDIGTVILPNADLKIFLTASSEARAKRRYAELIEKGQDVTYEKILADVIERDKNDSTRDVAPAIPAEDAILLDNSSMTLDRTADYIIGLLNERSEKSPKKDKPSKFYDTCYKISAKIIKLIWRIHPHGEENIPKSGAVMLAINHTAFSDVLVAADCSQRQVHYLAKAELFKIPLLGKLITRLGAVPIKRGKNDIAAIKTTISLLNEGKVVGIFPQGTRRKKVDPSKTPVKSGIGLIEYRTRACIVPVFIASKNYHTHAFGRNDVYFGKPLYPDDLPLGNGTSADFENIAKFVFSKVCELDPKSQK